MASFSAEIWTPGLTPNPSEKAPREIILAKNKTSKKAGGFRITTKDKQANHPTSSVFHPEDTEDDDDESDESDEEEQRKKPEKKLSVIPQIRPSTASSSSSSQSSPTTPQKKQNILYRIFHPQDETAFFGSSRRSVHSSDDEDGDCSDASSDNSTRSRISRNHLFRRDSNSSVSSNDSESESESEPKKNRNFIFKDILKASSRSSSTHSSDLTSSDDEEKTSKMFQSLAIKPHDWTLTPLPRTSSSSSSLSEKYGKKEEVLGRGAHAVVRLCQPINSDKKYAIKEFRKRKNAESQKEYVKKLVAEFCISSTLDFIHVVKTVDLIQDDRKQWCVVMEYCAGGDLYSRVHSGSLTDTDEINCYYKQLLYGVKYLHEMGVAHRDLKPENLLLSQDGKLIKITDFGVSEVFRTPFCNAVKKAKGLCGSGPYIAPEEFETKEYDAEAVDVWACGIIYYVLAFQSIPWRAAVSGDTRFKYYVDHYGKFWPFEKNLGNGMRKLMYRIMDINPVTRIKVNEILDDPFMKKVVVCLDNDSIDHKHQAGK